MEQKIVPGSRRYNLRTSRKNEIVQNMSQKRKKAAHSSSESVKKLMKVGDPCDQGPRSVEGIEESYLQSLIDARVEVFRPLKKEWYNGTVLCYDRYNKLHLLVYDEDAEKEWVSLERDKIRLLDASRILSKTPTSSNKSNSEKEETQNKHGIVEKSGGSVKAVEGTSVIGYRRKRKYASISKQLACDLQEKGGANEIRTTDGISESVPIHSGSEQASFGSPKPEIKSRPETRFTYQRRRRQGTSNALSFRRDKVLNFNTFVQQPEELLIVEEALDRHMSLLSLRQPSYWQCVAHAMQLSKRGSLAMVKSQSLEDLMFALGSLLHFFSASDKKSSSYPIVALREYFKPMTTLSDINVQVCLVGNMSIARQLHFQRSFQEVFRNFSEYGVSVMGNRFKRTANLRVASESFSVRFTSLKAGLSCPLTRNYENIHSLSSAEYNDLSFMSEDQLLSDSSGGSAANEDTLALVPLQGLGNYAHDTDIINVLRQSNKNIFLSNSRLGLLDHSENVCGGSHNIQSLQMSYVSAPSLFTNLHQRVVLGRNSYNQLNLQPLPKRLPRTKRECKRILVRSECDDPLVGKSWSVQAYFGKRCCEPYSPPGHVHKLKNPTRFCRVDAPNELLGYDKAVPFRSTRSARPGRRGRQCRSENRSEKLNFSKPGSELDSLSCTTNILIARVDQGWTVSDAEVTLKSLNANEWTLDVKVQGLTTFTHKPQEAKICKTQEERITRVSGQVHRTSKSHITIWKTGLDWSLEFPNRRQWILFKKLYKECYERNNGSFSHKHKDIPLPGMQPLNNDENLNNDIVRFARPPTHYLKITEDEVTKAISNTHVLYDMDSDDEQWLCQVNSNASDEISDETFERIINELEKLVFMTQPLLTIDDAVKILSDLIPVEGLRSIYSYWEEKRSKKGKALVRQFQLGISTQALYENSSVQSSKGKEKPAIRPPSNWARNQGMGMLQGPTSYIDAGLQKDTWDVDAYFKSKKEIDAVRQKRVHKRALQNETQMEIDTSNIDARVEALREICTDKRRIFGRLLQNVDLKIDMAEKALRDAELIKKSRRLCFGDNTIALDLSTDGRANANTATRGMQN